MQATTTRVKNVNCLFANLNENKMTAQHNLSNWHLTLVTENGFCFSIPWPMKRYVLWLQTAVEMWDIMSQ